MDQSQIKVFDGVLGVQLNGQSTLVGTGKMIGMSDHGVGRKVRQGRHGFAGSLGEAPRGTDRHGECVFRQAGSRLRLRPEQLHASSFAAVNNPRHNSPCSNPCDSWRYNPWYGLVTYIPCGNNIYSPYGYRYWSPYNVMRAYYVPPAPVYNRGGGGGFGGGNAGYSGMSQTSTGYSGAMSTSSAGVSSPSAGAMSGSTGSASAGASSGGHGAAGGHGR